MSDLMFAKDVTPGQLIFQNSGAYLVDAVAVKDGKAYLGTNYGVLVLAEDHPVFVSEAS